MAILLTVAAIFIVVLAVLSLATGGRKDVQKIQQLIEEGRYEDAKGAIKKKMAATQDQPVWHYLLGRVYMGEMNFEYAVVEFKIIIKTGTYDRIVTREQVIRNIVDAYKRIGDMDDAISLVSSENRRKESPFSGYLLGSLFILKGDFPAAVEHLNRALALQPGYAMAMADLGHVFFKMGKEREALEKLEMAVNLDRRCAHAHFFLAEIYRSKKMFDKAIEHLESSRHDRDLRLNALFDMAMCFKGKEMNKNVIETLEKLFQEIESSPYYAKLAPAVFVAEARYQLGDAYMADKDFQAALDQWRIIQTLIPDFKDVTARIQANSRFGKDRVQDFIIAPSGEFEKTAMFIAESGGLVVNKVNVENNERAVLVTTDSRNHGRPTLLWVVRYPSPVGENILKDFEKGIKEMNCRRGVLYSPNGYSPTGIRYATIDKPFTLFGKAEFTKLLKDFERRHN